MSHEVENMMSVVETPWHGLGKILPKTPTVQEAIVAAGLDWGVRLQPLHMKYDGVEMSVEGHYATVRDTDRRVLGVVGPTYKPLQNKVAFDWFQPWLDSGKVAIETAGSLRGGRHVWVLARVLGVAAEVRPGDTVLQYILLSNGHDGTLALRNGFTGVRVVCANTMAAAHGDKASKLLKIRHTKKAGEALERVREIMNLAQAEFAGTMDQYRALARCGVTKDTLREYVQRVFQPKLVKAVEAGQNVEYLSHERGRSQDTRLDSLWFGDGARVNQRAMDEAVQLLRVA